MRPPIALLAALAAMAASGSVRAGDDTQRYMLRAELGTEYDSNAHRTESLPGQSIAPIGSWVGRGVLTGTLSDVVSAHQDVALSATAAGKAFQDPLARDEDVAVAESALTWRWTLSDRAALAAAGAYYEAFQRGTPATSAVSEERDFQSLAANLRFGLAVADRVELGVLAGYRSFIFKPDRNFDFDAPSVGFELRAARESADGAADWEGLVGAGYERRAFAGAVIVNNCQPPSSVGFSCQPSTGDALHVDQPWTAHLEVARTGRVLAGAGYALHYIASNSFDSRVIRHFVTARLAAPLPHDLFFSARADLLFAHYPEPLALTATTIEGENHSSIRADLAWSFADRLQLVARYTFYGPALAGSPISYLRQTFLLALAFTIEK